ncbi:SulP family inorganic anion transporter [Cupriavidus basilensis]|uniref:SulP family inorganic anion transporter n=2 Tax=Cupriavidus basilensis TaxID=68895 RepID=A0ABT6AXS7_9BURK|nr:SulP family inorganic anion transporter [Cupriavidus basilensis]MDF3837412.1 SulP family inorganic anion transporter [Cupriavidus basilensis]
MPAPTAGTAPTGATPGAWRADLVAGLAIAGLLLPEAVAYSGIAGLPPQAGVIALFAGLLVYGLLGSSRFAIVSATSSSAAVLLAATTAAAEGDAGLRIALGAAVILMAGMLFLLAAALRLGAISNLIAKPVLRGFALGLSLTIVLKQCPKILDVKPAHGDFLRLAWDLLAGWRHWNLSGAALALGALALLHLFARWRAVPGALLVIAAGIALDLSGWTQSHGIAAVGNIALQFSMPRVPGLTTADWMRAGELAAALALILYAESYGSIRTFAMRHGDNVSPNRDLAALGLANLASGLFQGMPVGAGFSGTSANESAGAQSRRAGLIAGAVVFAAVCTLLPWISRTPEPVLAAIVIRAVGHSLNPGSLKPYFDWRRDRLVALTAFAGVLLLGVLHGLLLAIVVSLAMLLHRLSRPQVSWLGRLADSHDFVDTTRHPEAAAPKGLLIARPEVPLFFGNVDSVLGNVRQALARDHPQYGLVLSLEESPDLDGTTLEALGELAVFARAHGMPLRLARVKDEVRDLLAQAHNPAIPEEMWRGWSVDDAVREAMGGGD